MSHTCSNLLSHIVFSTKNRMPWITDSLREELFPYLSGIIKELRGKTFIINGMLDHIHILAFFPPAVSISVALRTMKANFSGWVHKQGLNDDFWWQTGYGAFSIGRTEKEMVYQYIQNQSTHHGIVTYKDEFLRLLHEYDVEYYLRYIWD